jgi:haloalkane dehalogenase
VHILRTPDERFKDLPDFPFRPNYLEVRGNGESPRLRIHYLDEGPADVPPVLLMHGEPSWSYLYRKMIPVITAAGYRAIAPDLVGFGRSDKPARHDNYTYSRHVEWMTAWLDALDLQHITLFGHDWGGLIGLRMAAENEQRFDRLILANTGLPTGDQSMPEAFLKWREFSQRVKSFPVGRVINGGCVTSLSAEVIAAYEAPFPDETYKAGARVFPVLVPTRPDDPAAAANRQAWERLRRWNKPCLTLFSDSDPVTARGELVFKRLVPGAKGQPHKKIANAGHFLQEDKWDEVAREAVRFLASLADS